MTSLYRNNLRDHLNLFAILKPLEAPVTAAADTATFSLREDCRLLFCGNSDPADDRQHLTAELTGRYVKDRKSVAALALSNDTSAPACIGNDISLDDVFDCQLGGLSQAGYGLIGRSTSGNSENVIHAVTGTREMHTQTIGLLVLKGDKLRTMCNINIVEPSTTTADIQGPRIYIDHTLCGMIEQTLGLVDED